MKDYSAIFEGVESTLIREGSRNLPDALIRSPLESAIERGLVDDVGVREFLEELQTELDRRKSGS